MSTVNAINVFAATGRRKTSSARVNLRHGSGRVLVNGRSGETYFTVPHLEAIAKAPLHTVGMVELLDVEVKVHGSGISGQAGAISHGIARALEKMDPALRAVLKKAGHLTRDSRQKERKKPGQPKARKRFQFSKR